MSSFQDRVNKAVEAKLKGYETAFALANRLSGSVAPVIVQAAADSVRLVEKAAQKITAAAINQISQLTEAEAGLQTLEFRHGHMREHESRIGAYADRIERVLARLESYETRRATTKQTTTAEQPKMPTAPAEPASTKSGKELDPFEKPNGGGSAESRLRDY